MTYQTKNRIKAWFLLLVFSLNTVAGFACSIGVDMGYNTHHHPHGTVHEHGVASVHDATHQHHSHHHQVVFSGISSQGSKDDCCAGDVANFIKLDKSLAHNDFSLKVPVFLFAFTGSFFSLQTQASPAVKAHAPFVRRSYFQNDTDIRIAINPSRFDLVKCFFSMALSCL